MDRLVAMDEECVRTGEIMQIWKNTIEMEKWFDPDFQEFVDKELIPRTPKNKRS